MRQTKLARLAIVSVVSAGLAAAWLPTAVAQTAPLPVTLTVQLEEVRLFGDAVISGRLDPPHHGGYVLVSLVLEGKLIGRHQVLLGGDGSSFKTTIPVERWGRYRAQATFEGDADHSPATTTTEPKVVKVPGRLHSGSNGDAVLALEQRLDELNYHIPRPDRRFDFKTGDVVLAFHKVNGMGRGETVTKATWRRLSHPRIPKPKAKRPKVHIEVDQTKQVAYVVREGEIDDIWHVSTGAGGATRDGVFNVHRKIAGFSPGRLYYPSYFDGNRAVHGWPDVPTTPASHGCVRVPYWTAKWIFGIMHYGMQVRVYH
jgi:lipoprotein-anchoring transpeptidase ErfK/SrfK